MSNSATPHAIAVTGLNRTFRMGKVPIHVLHDVSVNVQAGEFVSIIGASGSGKSTLLHLIGLLDKPNGGEISIHGQKITKLSAGRKNALRCNRIGFVFQFYHLLPELNVLQNVLLAAHVATPLWAWAKRRKEIHDRAGSLLDELGLADRLRHKPSRLSGGERQRVALARAMMNEPDILLADEPTGNLDTHTGRQIMDVLHQFHRAGQTILMVTHDHSLAGEAQRTLCLTDGRLEDAQ
jgi:lipoprotein-releasing system ATP-binding protein